MERLYSALTKQTPDHLQVVGPRLAGKTVVLHVLADRMRGEGSPYAAVDLWDLGHQTPESDEAFMCRLRDQLVSCLCAVSPVYAEHLRKVEGNPYKDLCEVFDALKAENKKVLMLWDGFDKPLANGRLTRNLWDQLRELASRSSLRLVTASRRRLHDLIRNADSQTSDFWNIFEPSPVRVECFDEDDVAESMSKLSGINLSQGARTELLNWTGSFPPLMLSLLNAIRMAVDDVSLEPGPVNHIAEITAEDLSGILSELWSDCPESSKDVMLGIVGAGGSIESSKTSQADLGHLIEKGFVKRSGSKVVSNCRFLERHLARTVNDVGSLARLFGSPEDFRANARPLLERRLTHMDRLDAQLKRYLESGIEDIPDYPEVCLRNVRGIVDRALDLIWDAEFGANRNIPSDWFSVWKHCGEPGPEKWNEQFPAGNRAFQLGLLQLVTGTAHSAPRAKFVTKNTYALANAAKGFGDFGQHLEGVRVDVGVAFAALSVCLELAASIERELP